MKKYIVMYKCPVARLDEWAKTPETERKEVEAKMRQDWMMWVSENKEILKESYGAGKTKLVTTGNVSDTRNDLMCADIVEAESADVVGEKYKNHPHLSIPDATIEITELRTLGLN